MRVRWEEKSHSPCRCRSNVNTPTGQPEGRCAGFRRLAAMGIGRVLSLLSTHTGVSRCQAGAF